MAMRGFGSRFLRMSSRHDHMKNALKVKCGCLGLRGYTAVNWSSGNAIELMSDVDLGINKPLLNQYENPASETIAPANVIFKDAGLDVTSRFDMRCIQHNVTASRHHAFLREGWTIYACNTQSNQRVCLGFIPAENQLRQLTDIPLADGVYEIEIVASHAFWDSARSRQRLTLITGKTVPLLGLPSIQNLHRELTHFTSVIRWSVAADAIANDLQFGIWFGPTSPVDTAREPDQVIPLLPGVGNYQLTRFQTASEYVAVAVLGASDRGPVAELSLPWETMPPASPREQLAVP
ncbi:MAG: hypothetical protein FWD61_17265 [Phycisphaerales bacterium]|nr:hypothetical protein [Phycisphaerales bacterium]